MTTALRNFANATSEQITSYHNWAKNIEKARFGEGYTIVSGNINYYIVECVAKPFFSAIGDQLRKHPYLSAIGTLLIIAFFVHPNRKEGTGPDPVQDPQGGSAAATSTTPVSQGVSTASSTTEEDRTDSATIQDSQGVSTASSITGEDVTGPAPISIPQRVSTATSNTLMRSHSAGNTLTN